MLRLHIWMEGPCDSNREHLGQSEPELGPEALGTPHPTAPEFAGEQILLRELESFVHAAPLAGSKLGFRPGFWNSLSVPPLACTELLSDLWQTGVVCTLGRAPRLPADVHHPLSPRLDSSSVSILKVLTPGPLGQAFPPSPGLPFSSALWVNPHFLRAQEPL